MRFALINNERVEAKFGLKGICSVCNEIVIAKCGNIRVHHWSHQSERKCDNRWESQTEWHRAWKNNYPLEWQEKHHVDLKTKELHIADVLTENNLVIEFQHSHIDSKERKSREDFYTNLVWVVNGLRLKHTYSRFIKGECYRFEKQPNVMGGIYIGEWLPLEWIASSVPVIFDFQNGHLPDNSHNNKYQLYCLLPRVFKRYSIIIKITKQAFIRFTTNGQWQDRITKFIDKIRLEESEDEKLRLKYGL